MGGGEGMLRMSWMRWGWRWDGSALRVETVVWLAKQAWALVAQALKRGGPSLEVEHCVHGQLRCRFVLDCRPCHPKAWISDEECFEPWGGVRIRFVAQRSSFSVLCAGLFRDRLLLHAERSLCASLALNQVLCLCACSCKCFLSPPQLNVTSQSQDPGSTLDVWGIQFSLTRRLAAKPSSVQVLQSSAVREKQVGSARDGLGLAEICFHLRRTWPVAMWMPFSLAFPSPSHSALSRVISRCLSLSPLP